jgi:hypothetical protein
VGPGECRPYASWGELKLKRNFHEVTLAWGAHGVPLSPCAGKLCFTVIERGEQASDDVLSARAGNCESPWGDLPPCPDPCDGLEYVGFVPCQWDVQDVVQQQGNCDPFGGKGRGSWGDEHRVP